MPRQHRPVSPALRHAHSKARLVIRCRHGPGRSRRARLNIRAPARSPAAAASSHTGLACTARLSSRTRRTELRGDRGVGFAQRVPKRLDQVDVPLIEAANHEVGLAHAQKATKPVRHASVAQPSERLCRRRERARSGRRGSATAGASPTPASQGCAPRGRCSSSRGAQVRARGERKLSSRRSGRRRLGCLDAVPSSFD